jgi:hypothetical protein
MNWRLIIHRRIPNLVSITARVTAQSTMRDSWEHLDDGALNEARDWQRGGPSSSIAWRDG